MSEVTSWTSQACCHVALASATLLPMHVSPAPVQSSHLHTATFLNIWIGMHYIWRKYTHASINTLCKGLAHACTLIEQKQWIKPPRFWVLHSVALDLCLSWIMNDVHGVNDIDDLPKSTRNQCMFFQSILKVWFAFFDLSTQTPCGNTWYKDCIAGNV